MAVKEGAGQHQCFVKEIDYSEIEKLEVIGKGSFGVVRKGIWREKYVAVKCIDSEPEKKAFEVEVRQLSRVNHPNIVKLYGACMKEPVCLVMEYAEGGSLYNVLHGMPRFRYSAGHAMSWALQCARGVAYLHGMTPKALIHRDLKPPNLLLIMGGKVLKICDFGTACDQKTYMTNNKGSAAWMAPEVFEGSNYTEKCDVFSWGIILWEVLTRQKPFGEIGGSAFRIMWAVHKGKRPPLIENCPPAIENLMTCCWDKIPSKRPSMEEVVREMSHLFQFFTGADEPLLFVEAMDESNTVNEVPEDSLPSETIKSLVDTEFHNTPINSSQTQISNSINGAVSIAENTRSESKSLPQVEPKPPLTIQVDEDTWRLPAEKENYLMNVHSTSQQGQAKNGSQTGSTFRVLQPCDQNALNESYPALLLGNKPGGQHYGPPGNGLVHGQMQQELIGSPNVFLPCVKNNSSTRQNLGPSFGLNRAVLPQKRHPSDANMLQVKDDLSVPDSKEIKVHGHRRTASQGTIISTGSSQDTPFGGTGDNSPDVLEKAYMFLDRRLHPINPVPTCQESKRIFDEHNRMAQEYLKVQTEIALLYRCKRELADKLSEAEGRSQLDEQDLENYQKELRELEGEKESLVKLHQNLEKQLEMINSAQIMQHRAATSTSNDGWVVVPRQDH